MDTIKKQRILSLKHKISEQQLESLTVNGKPFPYPTLNLTIALNKPESYLCSTQRESSNHKIIYDLLPSEFLNRNPTLGNVGRLDLDSCGLLIMTQDGDLHHRILSADVEKTYLVEFVPPIESDAEVSKMKDLFFSGDLQLRSEDSTLKPITNFEYISPSTISISIVEGKYHQGKYYEQFDRNSYCSIVRRMFAACSKRVTGLKRIKIGELTLESLDLEAPGSWCVLSNDQTKAFSKREK